MLNQLDVIIIVLYIVAVNVISSLKQRNKNVDDYLLNSRNTSFFFLLCSTAATIAGAGTVVGVSAEAGRTGISFGIITGLAISSNMLLYIFLVPRIRAACDIDGIRNPAELLRARCGPMSHCLLSLAYVLVAMIWTAVQFLAIANLFGQLFGFSIPQGLLLAYLVVVVYTAIGGLLSDIISDFVEFWIKLLVIVFMLPSLFSTHGSNSASLPPSYFDPTAYGGVVLLIGSAVIGGLYPLAQAHDWMRINSARSTRDARLSYLFALPIVLAFVASAVYLGLVGAVEGFSSARDSLLFRLFDDSLPTGIRGIAYAGVLAVVMSSINSIMLGAAATLHSMKRTSSNERTKIRELRALVALFGAFCAFAAGLYPRLVELTVIGSFTSLCLGPVIILTLLEKLRSDKIASLSIVLGILGLAVSLPLVGKSAFLFGLLGAVSPILLQKLLNLRVQNLLALSSGRPISST